MSTQATRQQVTFRFYAELNDFMPQERKQRAFVCPLEIKRSIKDMIESLGVPHTEVDLILVNGQSVDFRYQVAGGDSVSVYPVFESLDIGSVQRVRPHPLRESRFVLDVHLGKLAAYLRMVGFDTLYRNDYADDELARISRDERRILLTRDRGLLKRSMVSHGYCIRQDSPRHQLVEVLRRFDLFDSMRPLQRCLRCNGELVPVDKESIADRLLPQTRRYYDRFGMCAECGQIYWAGSHYDRMMRFVHELEREGL